VAPLDKPVLVVGERGTGKEFCAERLHFLSKRWDRRLIKLNCAAIAETLLESELFGHEAGAFTGAVKRRSGLFEQADGGTLFLDEIASMSLRLQEKLLRVIEYGEFERVGGTQTLRVDVRLIGAANRDLPSMVEAGAFRADLLDRLSFDVITLPPLRHRPEDIPLLARHFALGMARELERAYFAGFSESALRQLQDHDWPGNLRELKNVIERAVYRHEADEAVSLIEFDPFDSPWRPREPRRADAIEAVDKARAGPGGSPAAVDDDVPLPADLKQHVRDQELAILERALRLHRYSQKETARALGLSYHQLRAYLRKYPQLLRR
jgi:psp operon transcriptional activator